MINEKLKKEFLTILRKEIPAEDGTIKIRMGVSGYIEDKEDTKATIIHLLDNLQAAINELKNRYIITNVGYGSVDGINGVVFNATISCK